MTIRSVLLNQVTYLVTYIYVLQLTYICTYIGAVLVFKLLLGATEKSLQLEIKMSDTIRNIKEKIQEIGGIPTERQILMLSGKELQDDFTISDYEIQSESTIMV